MQTLPTIPLIDIRDSNLVALLQQRTAQAHALMQAAKKTFGVTAQIASTALLPAGDALGRRWLRKTNNIYANEIAQFADIMRVHGVTALNLSLEWGCTSGAYALANSTTLMRVLDWPFSALGKNVVVAHQRGQAGDFYNITWPAMSGVFQGMAPQRFAAALNQAPMRRFKIGGLPSDWLRNRYAMYQSNALPPAHVLRWVFETAPNYAEAKRLLCETPIAVPVIYTLTGTAAHEGCVIERTETTACVRELGDAPHVVTANHFETYLNGVGNGWWPRPLRSGERACGARQLTGAALQPDFAWFTPPVANPCSRLALVANAQTGTLAVLGTQGTAAVTQPLVL